MILQLDCPVQTYAWGKMGSASKVAQLASGGTSGFVVDEKKPYAEVATHGWGGHGCMHQAHFFGYFYRSSSPCTVRVSYRLSLSS